jgi:hypothetical protein
MPALDEGTSVGDAVDSRLDARGSGGTTGEAEVLASPELRAAHGTSIHRQVIETYLLMFEAAAEIGIEEEPRSENALAEALSAAPGWEGAAPSARP